MTARPAALALLLAFVVASCAPQAAAEVPAELRRLENQTGASWQGITEWSVNLDVVNRTAEVLRGRGYAVDVLPMTVPPGYLADVFLAL